MITAAAKDLVEDFYPYFNDTFDLLVQRLLTTHDGDQLEWVLTCIAHLFKVLKKSLKRDFITVFQKILPLLCSNEYIMNFMAECFAFVTRDIGKRKDFVQFILRYIHKEHITGCGRLFFEMIRGVSGGFHLEAKPILTQLFEMLLEKEINREFLFQIHVQIMTDIIEHIHLNHLDLYNSILQSTLKNTSEEDSQSLKLILLLLGQLIEGWKGHSESSISLTVESIFHLLDKDIDDNVLSTLSKVVIVLVKHKPTLVTQVTCNRLCKKMMCIKNTNIVGEFIFAMLDFDQFELLLMPEFMRYFGKNLITEMLKLLVKILISKGCIWETGNDFSKGAYLPIMFM